MHQPFKLTLVGFFSALVAACSGVGEHTETTLFDGQTTLCVDSRLVPTARRIISWEDAASARITDLEALISPRAGVLVEKSQSDVGPIGDALNVPFCGDKIPANATAYTTSSKSSLDWTEAETAAYEAWKATEPDVKVFANYILYAVDGTVRHINALAVER